jgi:hypothetical protein
LNLKNFKKVRFFFKEMLINNPIENLNRKIETKIYIFNVDNQCNFKLFENIEENMFFLIIENIT